MKSTKKRTLPEILNRGSLMTYQDNGAERCFGYMFEFPGPGVFEPSVRTLDVSPEEAKTHNQFLSQGEIEGLDKNCTVGLGGMFYTRKDNGTTSVAAWWVQEVSREVQVRGRVLTFMRKGMTFRGRLHREEDCFSFKRI